MKVSELLRQLEKCDPDATLVQYEAIPNGSGLRYNVCILDAIPLNLNPNANPLDKELADKGVTKAVLVSI